MRTRKEIKTAYEMGENQDKIALEVLLDIRDLLEEQGKV